MTPIEKARAYVHSNVQEPAMRHPDLPEKIKNKVKSSDVWLDHFERVGDLLAYLKRFEVDRSDPIYLAMHGVGLRTFEDIVHDFEREFSLWANDCTRADDFIIGETYDTYQILIFSKNYDTRSGGMFVLESGGQPSYVVIKATLSNGDYPNEWIEAPRRIKYYLKSIDGTFGEHYKTNAAILNDHNLPILTFVRDNKEGQFTYQGIFKFKDITREADGTKWFDLVRNDSATEIIESSQHTAKTFADEVAEARLRTQEERQARLARANKKPAPIQVLTSNFRRNPDVVVEVLERANGYCEGCKAPAPFIRKSDNTPYLEVHHTVPLAQGGEDTVANAIALCPNCHRNQHYG